MFVIVFLCVCVGGVGKRERISEIMTCVIDNRWPPSPRCLAFLFLGRVLMSPLCSVTSLKDPVTLKQLFNLA